MTGDFKETILPEEEISYGKVIRTVLSRWYWIAACVVVALALAWLYLSVVHPKYSATASLKLTDQKSEATRILNADAAVATDIESFNLTQSATFIIRSDAFLEKAISRLNYRYSIFAEDQWSKEEQYPAQPVEIDILRQDSVGYYSGLIRLVTLGGGKFTLLIDGAPEEAVKQHEFGDTITIPGVVFRVMKTFTQHGRSYYFRFHTRESLFARVANNLSVDPQNSSILALTFTDFNPYFASDILNVISEEYILHESQFKNQSGIQRLRFIDAQLDTLTSHVNELTLSLENLKRRNNISNSLPVKVQTDIARMATLQTNRSTLDLERININQLQQQAVNTGSRLTLNFGLEGEIGGLLSSLVSQYNVQISDREKQLETYTPNSDVIRAIDKKLNDIRSAIFSNLQQLRNRNSERQRYFDDQIARVQADLEMVPAEAKDLVKLQTEYDINKKIFTNFTEERYKTQIELAALAPTASVIYPASPSGIPVSPQRKRVYALALAAGIGTGILLIFFARMVNTRLRDIGGLLIHAPVPVIGHVKPTGKRIPADARTFSDYPDSPFAESIRDIRANIVNTLQRKGGKVIVLSSEISNEGRSFISYNLAVSLAQTGKRVIFIDADLRKPLPGKFSYAEELGLSAFLINFKSMLSIIKHTDVPGLDIIPSGVAPSNPSELLQSPKMAELIRYVRNLYDYVAIDTSAIGTFSDAVPILELADLNLYVIRGNVSGADSIPVLKRLISDYKLKTFAILLNGFRKNYLYQSFAPTNTDIYLKSKYARYLDKYDDQGDAERWQKINPNG